MMSIDLMTQQQKKSLETKNKIMEAAERVFTQYGFKYLTVRNICAEAQVVSGSFYHFFGTKENLVFLYGKNLFQRVQARNPCPQSIPENDYMNRVLWYFVVYGTFCQYMGKDFMHCVYQMEAGDIFEDTYRTVIIPILTQADTAGLLQHYENIDVLGNLVKDIQILYQGSIMWWCGHKEENEPLAATLEHLLLHTLSAHQTISPNAVLKPSLMLTDTDYQATLDMREMPERKEEDDQQSDALS